MYHSVQPAHWLKKEYVYKLSKREAWLWQIVIGHDYTCVVILQLINRYLLDGKVFIPICFQATSYSRGETIWGNTVNKYFDLNNRK